MIKKRIIGIWRRFFPSNKKLEFSIGIYYGSNPLKLEPFKGNPVLTKEDVTDRKADYIADPFMIMKNDKWYMFFEIKIKDSFKTELAYATSKDCFNWKYEKALDIKPLFRSYPYVFEFENVIYMLPETEPLKSIILYSAEDFPEKWKKECTIASGKNYVDPSIFRYNNKWWIFVSTTNNSELYLFYSDSLKGPWEEHKLNPIIKNNPSFARPGGRVIEYQSNLYRVGQDCKKNYGECVRAFKIKKLSVGEYEEELVPNPIISKGTLGWNLKGMHTFDAHELEDGSWIAVVDGYKEGIVWEQKHLNS